MQVDAVEAEGETADHNLSHEDHVRREDGIWESADGRGKGQGGEGTELRVGPDTVVVVHDGGARVVVPHEEAEADVASEELRYRDQADAGGPLIAQTAGSRVDAKVGLEGAARVLEGLQQVELVGPERPGLVSDGLEELRAEGELLILGLDQAHEIGVRIEHKVIHVAGPPQGLSVDELHNWGPLLLDEPEKGEGRVPRATLERGVVWIGTLVEGGSVPPDAPVCGAPAKAAQDERFTTLALSEGNQVVSQSWLGGGHDGWEIVTFDHLVRAGSQRRGDTDDEVEVCWRIGEKRSPGGRAMLGTPFAKMTREGRRCHEINAGSGKRC